MRILCVCRSGRVRSAAMKLACELRGHEAINVGVLHHSPYTMSLLMGWAEMVLVPEPSIGEALYALPGSHTFHAPMRVLDIGPDVWRTRLDDDLLRKCQKAIRNVVPEVKEAG